MGFSITPFGLSESDPDIVIPHAGNHEDGGSDELNVDGLSGLLADDQHVLDAEVQTIVSEYIGSNICIVQSGQTIQAVIDSCPVAAGSLKEGFTNPYVVRVPPGHEKEYYSLVRDVADAASDKRNVKVIFEDNPEGKFIVDQWFSCDDITDWSPSGVSVLTEDNTHNFEGENCFKITAATGNAVIHRSFPVFDIRKYQGMLIDFEINPSEISELQILFYDDNVEWTKEALSYISLTGRSRFTVYLPLPHSNTSFDYSLVGRFFITGVRKAGYVGTCTLYVDNIRLVRTTPHNVAILEFDDSTDEHFSIAMKLLDAKGWKGSFAVTQPYSWGTASALTVEQVKSMAAHGHNIINHTLEHLNMSSCSAVEAYSDFKCMQKCLEHHGVDNARKVFVAPGGHSTKHVIDYLGEAGCLQVSNQYCPFPAHLEGLSNPSFTITTDIQKFIDSKIGGILNMCYHTITNEANFLTSLDWIAENFSEIILASKIVDRLPKEYQSVTAVKSTESGISKTLSADFRLYFYHGQEVHLDPGGAARNVTPVGSNSYGEPMEFRPFHRIELINTADAAENLIFDPTFTAIGNHVGAAHETIMTDPGESWPVGSLVGRTINNTPDGSSGVVTANTLETVTAVLSGGTSNDWQNGEAYTITPAGLNQTVGQDQRATFVYDGEGWDIVNLYDKTP